MHTQRKLALGIALLLMVPGITFARDQYPNTMPCGENSQERYKYPNLDLDKQSGRAQCFSNEQARQNRRRQESYSWRNQQQNRPSPLYQPPPIQIPSGRR
jgi:hypothetical protein